MAPLGSTSTRTVDTGWIFLKLATCCCGVGCQWSIDVPQQLRYCVVFFEVRWSEAGLDVVNPKVTQVVTHFHQKLKLLLCIKACTQPAPATQSALADEEASSAVGHAPRTARLRTNESRPQKKDPFGSGLTGDWGGGGLDGTTVWRRVTCSLPLYSQRHAYWRQYNSGARTRCHTTGDVRNGPSLGAAKQPHSQAPATPVREFARDINAA
jgi:hypothetical protein